MSNLMFPQTEAAARVALAEFANIINQAESNRIVYKVCGLRRSESFAAWQIESAKRHAKQVRDRFPGVAAECAGGVQ